MLPRKPSQPGGWVLHPLEPGLDQRGELGEVGFGQVGEDLFRCDQTGSTGLSSWAYGGAGRQSASSAPRSRRSSRR